MISDDTKNKQFGHWHLANFSFLVLKYQVFFRSAGNVIQQIKNVSPNIGSRFAQFPVISNLRHTIYQLLKTKTTGVTTPAKHLLMMLHQVELIPTFDMQNATILAAIPSTLMTINISYVSVIFNVKIVAFLGQQFQSGNLDDWTLDRWTVR